jgi:hypothetical protein
MTGDCNLEVRKLPSIQSRCMYYIIVSLWFVLLLFTKLLRHLYVEHNDPNELTKMRGESDSTDESGGPASIDQELRVIWNKHLCE